ncbi:MAG: MBL fold metallo-hydrolase [Deltaproteobacteria bacterium]|nr:MBL fold metallo-hydrolase [Deltaproteobacteria bacterium]
MDIYILSAESLGVRGLCCYVKTGERRILIDPGLALGYMRHRRLPHPEQVAMAEKARRTIIDAWKGATDIIFSHFHGDHVPLVDANPYQLRAGDLAGLNIKARVWCKNREHLSPTEVSRTETLRAVLGLDFLPGEDAVHGPMRFSRAVPHGDPEVTDDTVMMTLVEGDRRFLHAPDIQLLCDKTVSGILDWRPDILLAGGPPLYLSRLSEGQIDRAWQSALRLANALDLFILDHHLLRCTEGVAWLDRLSRTSGKAVLCAADFMGRKRAFMEANRETLYLRRPVPESWHEDYAKGLVTTEDYRQETRQSTE